MRIVVVFLVALMSFYSYAEERVRENIKQQTISGNPSGQNDPDLLSTNVGQDVRADKKSGGVGKKK